MKISVRPIGPIKRYVSPQEMDVREGITSRSLIQALKIPTELKMVSFVNGRKRPLDEPLHDGDEVKLVTLLTGG